MLQFKWRQLQHIALSVTLLLSLNACGTHAFTTASYLSTHPLYQQEAHTVAKEVLEEIFSSNMPMPTAYKEALQATLHAIENHKIQFIVADRIVIDGQPETEVMGAYSTDNTLLLPAYLFKLSEFPIFLKSTVVHELVHAAQDWLYQGQTVTHGDVELEAYLIEHIYVQHVLQSQYIGDAKTITLSAQALAEHWLQMHENPSDEHKSAYHIAETALLEAMKESYNIEQAHQGNNGF